ncbi:MAG: ribbon-helix-helix domain-containing protein [Pseudomonadota bacterium]
MCNVYASTDPADYESTARSIRLHGMVTSIRLERRFWAILERMAANEGLSVPQLVTVLHDEVLEKQGEIANFTSFLRVTCTTYLSFAVPEPVPGQAAAS